MFENLFEEGNDALGFLKSLYENKDIEIKSDANMSNIRGLCSIKLLSLKQQYKSGKITADELVQKFTEYYLILKVSYQRKSRQEAENILSDLLKKDVMAKAKYIESVTK